MKALYRNPGEDEVFVEGASGQIVITVGELSDTFTISDDSGVLYEQTGIPEFYYIDEQEEKTVLDINESFGSQTTIEFPRNVSQENDNGALVTLVPNQSPIRKFTISKQKATEADVDKLIAIQDEAKGAEGNFLFKDRIDYKAEYEKQRYFFVPSSVSTFQEGVEYGEIFSQGILFPAPDGVRTEFQLCKIYQAGFTNHIRPITRIEKITQIFVNGSFYTDFTISQGGKLTFSQPLPAWDNYALASFEFYNLAYFRVDDIRNVLLARNQHSKPGNQIIYNIEGLEIEEDREDAFIYPTDKLKLYDNRFFPTDLWIDSVFRPSYNTEILRQPSGYTKRTARREKATDYWTLGAKPNLTPAKKDELMSFWLAVHGNAANWVIYNPDLGYWHLKGARFEDTSITFTANSLKVFGVNALNVRAFDEYQILNLATPTTSIAIDIDNSGSMANDIAAMQEGFQGIEPFLLEHVYNNDQTAFDTYYRGIRLKADEAWINWQAEDIRPSPDAPKQQLRILAINEAHPSIDPNNLQGRPTSAYNNQLANLQNWYAGVEFQFTIVIGVAPPDGANDQFITMIENFSINTQDIYAGNDPYTVALADYGLLRPYLNIPSGLPGSFYFSLLSGVRTGGATGAFADPILKVVRIYEIIDNNGNVYRATECDRDIEVDGQIYKAAFAPNPAAHLQNADRETPNNSEITGYFRTDLFDEALLRSGLFWGALIRIYDIKWDAPPATLSSAIRTKILRISGIEFTDSTFVFKTDTNALFKLRRNRSDRASNTCSKRFPFCFEDPLIQANYEHSTTIATVISNGRFTVSATLTNLKFGEVEFISGNNKGSIYAIADFVNNEIILYLAPFLRVQVGDEVIVREGCDKLPPTCRAYNNYANFGGIPDGEHFLPGARFLTNPPTT